MERFQGRIRDGLRTELIGLPRITEDIRESDPEKRVQVCASGYLVLPVLNGDD